MPESASSRRFLTATGGRARSGPSLRLLVVAVVLLALANVALLVTSFATRPAEAAEPDRPSDVEITADTPGIGDPVEVGDVLLTVRAIEHDADPESFQLVIPTDPSGTYVTVDIEVTNPSDETVALNLYRLRMIDADGRRHGVDTNLTSRSLEGLGAFLRLAPGQSVDGWLVLHLADGVVPDALWIPSDAAAPEGDGGTEADERLVSLR